MKVGDLVKCKYTGEIGLVMDIRGTHSHLVCMKWANCNNRQICMVDELTVISSACKKD